jgi:hypothetical protein
MQSITSTNSDGVREYAEVIGIEPVQVLAVKKHRGGGIQVVYSPDEACRTYAIQAMKRDANGKLELLGEPSDVTRYFEHFSALRDTADS